MSRNGLIAVGHDNAKILFEKIHSIKGYEIKKAEHGLEYSNMEKIREMGSKYEALSKALRIDLGSTLRSYNE